MRTAVLLVLVCAAAASPPLLGQMAGEQLPTGRTVPEAEAVNADLEKSRYRFGALRVQPVLGVKNLGYQGNVFGTGDGEVGDWQGTIAGGARAILPAGRKVFFRAAAIPEYTWYRQLVDRRRFGGEYSASALALFNRMSLEAAIRPVRTVARVSSEEERTVPTSTVHVYARGEVEPLRRLILFASGDSLRTRYSLPQNEPLSGNALERLNRNEEAVRAGVRYRFRPHFTLSAGLESAESEFANSADRNNTSRAAIMSFRYDRPKTFVNLAVAARRVESTVGESQAFPDYSTTTGSYSILHRLGAPVAIDVFGRRALTYSIDTTNPYFIETRNGAAVSFPLTRFAFIRLSADAGTNTYPIRIQVAGSPLIRTDDVSSLAAAFAIRLFRNIGLSTLASNTRYNSNVPGYDRVIFSVTGTLIFAVSGDLFDERR